MKKSLLLTATLIIGLTTSLLAESPTKNIGASNNPDEFYESPCETATVTATATKNVACPNNCPRSQVTSTVSLTISCGDMNCFECGISATATAFKTATKMVNSAATTFLNTACDTSNN